MPLPFDPTRLHGIRSFDGWKTAVEKVLTSLDSRIAANRQPGEAVIWLGGTVPAGLLRANGQVVPRATYPALFAAIGTSYNTGGEASGTFRLPNMTTTTPGFWAIRT